MNNGNLWITFGAFFGFLAVAVGAFGAHGLQEKMSPAMLAIYQTGAQYQMYHALALLGLGLWSLQSPHPLLNWSGWAFVLGILIFSGSLYALSLSGIRILGAITPIGGVLFLVGWTLFFLSAYRKLVGHQP